MKKIRIITIPYVNSTLTKYGQVASILYKYTDILEYPERIILRRPALAVRQGHSSFGYRIVTTANSRALNVEK